MLPRAMISRWPFVTGSNDPGYIAIRFINTLHSRLRTDASQWSAGHAWCCERTVRRLNRLAQELMVGFLKFGVDRKNLVSGLAGAVDDGGVFDQVTDAEGGCAVLH